MDESLDLLNNWLTEQERNGTFYVPQNATPQHIAAISSDEKFDAACLRGLYILENAMTEKGLDPDAFCINKYNASAGANYPGSADTNIIMYGYEISYFDDRYSIRRKNDMDFLAYFSSLILDDEDEKKAQGKKSGGSLLTRLSGWFRQKAV